MAKGAPLRCPGCGRRFEPSARLCPDCGLPLALQAALEGRAEEVSEARRQARLVKPQYAEGELVKVAVARNMPEGELLRELLLEAGVPCLLQRTCGLAADLMAGAPCDVMVPRGGLQVAREALLQEEGQGAG
ncbi:MAG: hypothetical protein KGJ43_02185 [Acidobacteriota bacterium]|nr:hypothetical protein [Acidobacteriota bacterium]